MPFSLTNQNGRNVWNFGLGFKELAGNKVGPGQGLRSLDLVLHGGLL